MRLVIAAACATLLATGLSPAVAAIVRCEATDGKVTYSNTECPQNTKMVRQVEPSSPVVVHDGGRPQAGAGDDRPAVRLEASRPPRVEDPVRIDEELNAQLAEQRRECEARARELQRLQDDVNAAATSARASAELSMRRAQDDYRALCPRQR